MNRRSFMGALASLSAAIPAAAQASQANEQGARFVASVTPVDAGGRTIAGQQPCECVMEKTERGWANSDPILFLQHRGQRVTIFGFKVDVDMRAFGEYRSVVALRYSAPVNDGDFIRIERGALEIVMG